MHARAISMRAVDQLVGPVQAHRVLAHAHQVAAPPVEFALVLLHPLDDDQQVGVDRQDRIPGPLGGQAPVGGRVVAAPGSPAARLVVQIHPDHRIVPGVPLGQHDPVIDPALFAVLRGVPQLGLGMAVGPVPVEDDLQPALSGSRDDPIHNLQPGQSL